MKVDVAGVMKRFSGAMIQPVMFLSVAGIMLALASVLRLTYMPAAVIGVGDFLYNLFMNGFINNLVVIFVVGLTCAFAKKQKTDAAVVAIASFLCYLYADNYWLNLTGTLAQPAADGSFYGTGQAMVLGVQVVDMGVFISIILGCINGWIYNKLCDVQFPDAVRIYGGTKLAFLVCCLAAALLGVAATYFWPPVASGISALQGFIENAGYAGLFVYGFLNRILIPTGLHHLVWMPFNYTSVGGVAEIAGQVYQGAVPIYTAEIGNIASITSIDPSVRYIVFGFSKVFGSIGCVLAFIATAKPEKRAQTKALLIPSCFTAVLAGITEPLEFTYLFVSPLLFLVHSLLDGIFQTLLIAVGYLAQCGSIIDIITAAIIIPWDMSHIYLIVPVGLAAIVIWFLAFRFFILKFDLKTPGREDEGEEIDLSKMNRKAFEAQKAAGGAAVAVAGVGTAVVDDDATNVQHIIDGLGGPDNIVSLMNCFTRLRIDLKDMNLINEDEVNKFKNSGIVRGKNNVQIIVGMKVQDVFEKVMVALGRDLE